MTKVNKYLYKRILQGQYNGVWEDVDVVDGDNSEKFLRKEYYIADPRHYRFITRREPNIEYWKVIPNFTLLMSTDGTYPGIVTHVDHVHEAIHVTYFKWGYNPRDRMNTYEWLRDIDKYIAPFDHPFFRKHGYPSEYEGRRLPSKEYSRVEYVNL